MFDDSDEELEIQPLPKELKPAAPKQRGKDKKGNEDIEEINKLNTESQEKQEAMRIQANKELLSREPSRVFKLLVAISRRYRACGR